jgi:hypothetical protein
MKHLALAALGLALLACTGTTTEAQTCDAEVHVDTMSLTSDKQGLVAIPVSVDGNDQVVHVVVENPGNGYVSTDGLLDPSGEVVLDWEDWYESHDSLTDAFYANASATTLNWPVRESDPGLSEGEWTVYASTLNENFYYERSRDVDVTVIRRSCPGDPAKLKATIAYAGELESDAEVSAATEAAVERWAEIYADHGITLETSFVTSDLKASLTQPASGAAAYDGLYDDIGGEGVLLVVGDDVGGAADLYGMAGGIPGPQVATDHSVVAVSWLVHAGANASFSDAELEIYAETMAHEVGHFLGLYHPVEMGWNYWDALNDTDECQDTRSCESALKANLMFPYPVCGGGGCTQQVELSNSQVGVVGLNIGVQ